MTITLDDATKQQTITIDSAVVCAAIEGSFSDDRILTLKFHRNEITLDQAGKVTSKSIPGVIRATLSDPQKEIHLLHRKTLVPTGQTMNQGRLVQALLSLYHDEVAKQEKADAEEAAAAAAAQQNRFDPDI